MKISNIINLLNNNIKDLVYNNKLSKVFVKHLTLKITGIIDNFIEETKKEHYKRISIDLYNIFLGVETKEKSYLKKGKRILYNKIDCALALVKLIITKHTLVKNITCEAINISINRMHYYNFTKKQRFQQSKEIFCKYKKNIDNISFNIPTKLHFCYEATKIYDCNGKLIPEARRMFRPTNFTGKFNNYLLHIQQSSDDFILYILMCRYGNDVIPITDDKMKDWFLTGYYRQFRHRVGDYSVNVITFEL